MQEFCWTALMQSKELNNFKIGGDCLKKYLITGINGFVGQSLSNHLRIQGCYVKGTIRNPSNKIASLAEEIYITGSINGDTDWRKSLEGVDTLFHLAGTVHRPDIQDPKLYQTTISDATLALAKQAISAGVKRFVYASTSHVYGLETSDEAIIESYLKIPLTPYGQAKLMAENALSELMGQTAMEIVIVRLPLVYGAGVKGNFAQLVKLVKKLPILPFGCAVGKRSFVGMDNLTSFLYLCSEHKDAANQVFNISDDHDLSTRELCEMLSNCLENKTILLAISPRIVSLGLKLMGKQDMYNKLFGSMQLDISWAKTLLNWRPPYTIELQLKRLLAL